MRYIYHVALLLLPVAAFALNGVNEIPAFSEKRRALTSEFAVIQRDLKQSKSADQTNAIYRKLDDFCLRVEALRGDESRSRPVGILGECYEYTYASSYSSTTRRGLSAKAATYFNELKSLQLPTVGNYDAPALNKIQRVLDKMNDVLMASERVRACKG